MAAQGQRQGQQANLRLLALYEENHSEEFQTDYRGVTLSKTSDEWQVKDDDRVLDEFEKDDFDGPRKWIHHINGLAKHGRDYLEVTEGYQ